jgi:hypothetical protein
MMISYHVGQRHEEHWRFTKGWQVTNVENARDVARVILRYSNSAITWKHGERATKNFQGAGWAVLDVDSGATIQDAAALYGEYEHVIGTTRSHMKQKGNDKPRDRFRVWVRLDQVCTDPNDYRETVRQLGIKLSADPQACDAARKFLPCTKIVSGRVDGLTAPISKFSKPVVVTPQGVANMRQNFIPAFIREWLTVGAPEGSRNGCVFKTGYYLGRNGFNLDEILSTALHSNLANGISQGELTYTLRRGYHASK